MPRFSKQIVNLLQRKALGLLDEKESKDGGKRSTDAEDEIELPADSRNTQRAPSEETESDEPFCPHRQRRADVSNMQRTDLESVDPRHEIPGGAEDEFEEEDGYDDHDEAVGDVHGQADGEEDHEERACNGAVE